MRQRRRKSGWRRSPYKLYGGSAIGSVLISTGVLIGGGMHALTAYILAINGVTFVLFGFDKAIAHGTFTRVPERIFYMLAFAGASPALLLGQKLFRHKTIKSSFQVMFWGIVVVQIALLMYLFFDSNAAIVQVEHLGF